MKDWLINTITNICLYTIRKLNRHKDTSLSIRLHDLADIYDKWPTGQWNTEGSE